MVTTSLAELERLYLSAYGLLLGALVNAELERQTAADSTPGPDRPIGARGAVLADSVVTTELTEIYLQKRKRRAEDRLARKHHRKPAPGEDAPS